MSLKREIMNLINIIAEPTEVYNQINSSPRWRMPAALLILISPMIGFFLIPAAIEPLRGIYEESFGSQATEIALQTSIHYFTIINVVIEPLAKIIRWFILSAAIYSLVIHFYGNTHVTYKKMLAIVAYAEIIYHLMDIFTLLIIHARGISQIAAPSDLVVFKGVNYFIDSKLLPRYLHDSLSHANPFSIWYIAVVSRGLQISAGNRYIISLFFVTAAWCIWLAVKTGESYATGLALQSIF